MNDDRADARPAPGEHSPAPGEHSPAPGEHSPVWPPAPRVAPPVKGEAARLTTLTPHAWLDLSLGLAAGLLGTFLSVALVAIVGDLVSAPPSSDAKMRVEFCIYGALSAAACFILVRRFPLFGIMLTTGALIVLMILALPVWS